MQGGFHSNGWEESAYYAVDMGCGGTDDDAFEAPLRGRFAWCGSGEEDQAEWGWAEGSKHGIAQDESQCKDLNNELSQNI